MSTSASSKKKKSPEGLIIAGGNDTNRKAQWKIGKRVGEGACASVHLLDNMDGSSSGFVVKIVPVPTKTTKQGKSPEETNARLLNHEALMYQNQLPEYQGYIIPKMPPYIGPPPRAFVEGFEFITIERMKGSLWDAIPLLLDKASDEIAIGPILQQILLIVQQLHNMNHVLVDVKADNIMMAFSDHDPKKADAALAKILPSRAKKAAKSKDASLERAQDVARKLRILDFGLVTTWSGPDGIRPDAGISGVVGTPLYASLNVHEGHTPSRRDDIEAILYVCAEFIIRLVAASNGTYKALEGKGKQIPGFLPWSQEKSDEAIGKLKETQVTNIKSEFYERMGTKATAKAVKDMLDLVWDLGFKKTPDYDAIRDIMAQMKVSVHVPKKKAATKTPTEKATGRSSASAATTTTTAKSSTNTARVTRSTRSKRTAEEQEEDEDGSPPKHQKKASRVKKDADQFVDAAMDIESDEDDDDDGTTYEDAEEMEWEPDAGSKENKGSSELGITILVQKGPHAKEHFDLLQSDVDAVVIGKKPKHSKLTSNVALWPLSCETSIGDSHVRLELKASKQLCSVKVWQLNKSGFETKINGKPLKVSNIQAFINDTIQIGDTTLIVQGLKVASKSKNASVPVSKVAKAPKVKPSKAKAKSTTTQQAEETPAPSTKQGPTVRIAVIRGPHEGKELSMGTGDVLHLGSVASAAKKGKSFVLALDSAVENNHARFEFHPSKKLIKVQVTNLSSSGTFINGKQIPQGKESFAFLNDRVELGDTTIEIRG